MRLTIEINLDQLPDTSWGDPAGRELGTDNDEESSVRISSSRLREMQN
jgi:hypothetical protein